jgi:hypothetical protein
VERADFMMIMAGDPPDFRTFSDFRKRHLGRWLLYFVQGCRSSIEGSGAQAQKDIQVRGAQN